MFNIECTYSSECGPPFTAPTLSVELAKNNLQPVLSQPGFNSCIC
jgi:hypothetical protein